MDPQVQRRLIRPGQSVALELLGFGFGGELRECGEEGTADGRPPAFLGIVPASVSFSQTFDAAAFTSKSGRGFVEVHKGWLS
jgi:hypothetical protein